MTKEEARLTLQENFGLLSFEYPGRISEAIKIAIEVLSQPSLPSDIDEAAEKKARDIFESLEKHDIGEEKNRVLFGLLELEALALIFSHFGAEWMTAQWETIDGEITTTSDNGWEIIRIPKKLYPLGTKVTVQIRKK